MRPAIVALFLLSGCQMKVPAGGDLLDTGWFDDGAVTACTARVQATVPADQTAGWSWRGFPHVSVAEASDVYKVRLTDEGGLIQPTTVVVDNTGLNLDVTFDGGLKPSTGYVLELTDCAGTSTVTFRTSELGLPLQDGPDTVVGRTYELDLVNATWVEPGGFGSFLASNFDVPVLVGVAYADAHTLKQNGGPGLVVDGEVRQDLDRPTWDFPVSSFDDAPWFSTTAASINLDIGGYPLPVHNFRLEATFLPDGSGLGDGILVGLGDTRGASGALGSDDPFTICNYAAAIGAACQACPDGLPFCLSVELHDLVGTEIEGLRLVPVLGN